MPNLGYLLVLPSLVVEDAVPVPDVPTDATSAELHQHTVLDLVTGSGPVVQGVLIILLLMSVCTWGIVITKWLQMRKAKRQSSKFSDVFWSCLLYTSRCV